MSGHHAAHYLIAAALAAALLVTVLRSASVAALLVSPALAQYGQPTELDRWMHWEHAPVVIDCSLTLEYHCFGWNALLRDQEPPPCPPNFAPFELDIFSLPICR
jgi:hypothetical protein